VICFSYVLNISKFFFFLLKQIYLRQRLFNYYC